MLDSPTVGKDSLILVVQKFPLAGNFLLDFEEESVEASTLSEAHSRRVQLIEDTTEFVVVEQAATVLAAEMIVHNLVQLVE